jgi:hypothetical protein
VRQVGIRLTPEWSAAEEELICADTETPPINWVCITSFREDLWCHVRHTSRDSGEHTALGKVDSDVKIGKMGMASFVQENIVRFQITNGASGEVIIKGQSGLVRGGRKRQHTDA